MDASSPSEKVDYARRDVKGDATVTSSRQAVLFTTKDGVKIRKPRSKPKAFTEKEIREAVARALGKST